MAGRFGAVFVKRLVLRGANCPGVFVAAPGWAPPSGRQILLGLRFQGVRKKITSSETGQPGFRFRDDRFLFGALACKGEARKRPVHMR